MKTKLYGIFIAISTFFFFSCEPSTELKSESEANKAPQSLKTSLQQGVTNLSEAVTTINNSESFRLLSSVAPANVSESGNPSFAPAHRVDSMIIQLADIAGVYEYSWRKVKRMNNNLLRVFDRTADHAHLVVRLPSQKISNYHRLFVFTPRDTTLTNNFEASVSEYLLSRHSQKGMEYALHCDMKINNVALGTVTTNRRRNKINGHNFTSAYTLATGHVITNTQNTGDTTVNVYAISKDNKLIYEEKISTYRLNQESRQRERIFSLTIGNVTLVRKSGPDSFANAQIYVDGVLQVNAKAEIVITEETNEEKGVTYQKRDVKITFDDGTTTTLKTLKGATSDELPQLFRTVRQMGFATQIIDRIAANIYWTKN